MYKLNYFGIFSILLIFYGLFLSIFSVAELPTSMQGGFFPFLSDKPLGEDGFYMIKVAWNIAQNNGISYYKGELTSGIQPLITFFYSFICWINIQFFDSNKWFLLRMILLTGVFSHIILAYLIGKLTTKFNKDSSKNKLVFNISSALVLFSFGLFRLSTYGLETTFYLCGLSYFLIFLIENLEKEKFLSLNKSLGLGLISGLLILTRIDALIILFFTYLILIRKKKLKVVNSLQVFFISSILVSPWFIYVYDLTGNVIPSSGRAQAGVINFHELIRRSDVAFEALVSHALSILTIGREFLFLGSLFSLIVYLLLIFFNKNARLKVINLFNDDIFFAFFVSLLILFSTYIIHSDAAFFFHRYFAPSILLFMPIIAITLVEIYPIKKFYVYLFSLVLFTMQAVGSLHTGRVGNSHGVSAAYIQNNFRSEKFIIGCFQSGVIGFFNDNVINLDGKLNHKSLEAVKVSARNNQWDPLIDYVNEKKINVIIDWKGWVERAFGDLVKGDNADWEYCDDPINNRFSSNGTQSICIIKKNLKI